MDKNLYDLPPEEEASIPQVCGSLEEAINALKEDHEFLTNGDVFSEDFINAYIDLLKKDNDKIRMIPHPAEFELYYSL
jgi:glutamine synthetase